MTRDLDEIIGASSNEGDPLADSTVAQLIAERGAGHAFVLMDHLIANEGPPTGDPIIDAYLAKAAALPDWADAEKIKAGQAFFGERGWTILALLGCASLPEGYIVPEVSRVLATTLALEDHVRRRLWETTQFVLDVGTSGGLAPDGDGQANAVKVRLLHGVVRHLMTAETDSGGGPGGSSETLGAEMERVPWNPDWGLPINQRMMAGTILAFSFVPLRGLRRLGYTTSPEDEAAYIHLWNVAGHMMGVDSGLLAHTYDEAQTLFDEIRNPLIDSGADGIALADALIGFMEGMIPRWIPGLRASPRMMMVEVCDPETIKMLDISLTRLERLILIPMTASMRWWGRLQTRSTAVPGYDAVMRFIFTRLASAFVRHERGGKRNGFTIPVEVARRWNVDATG